MCWCVGGQTANMAEKGVTASGYGTEYTWQVRTVSCRAKSFPLRPKA